MTVCTHGDLINYSAASLENQAAGRWPDVPLSHIILTLSKPIFRLILLMLSTRLRSDKYDLF